MRIALKAFGDVGVRTGRILLAERTLTALGLYDSEAAVGDRRTMPISSLEGFDVLVTDSAESLDDLIEKALESGLSCVVSEAIGSATVGDRFASAGLTLLTGANLASGIAESLAAHEIARSDEELELTIGWTAVGSAGRKGEVLPFPDPVGARWGSRVKAKVADPVPTTRYTAATSGSHSAAVARVTGTRSGTVGERIVGVADEANHLSAIALAAGAISVAEGGFPVGHAVPRDGAEPYLEALLRIGMAVATLDL